MKRALIPLLVLAGLLVLLAAGLRRDPRELPSPLVDRPAPAFRLQTLGVGDGLAPVPAELAAEGAVAAGASMVSYLIRNQKDVVKKVGNYRTMIVEAPLLLLPRDVEKDLQDRRPLVGKQPLEAAQHRAYHRQSASAFRGIAPHRRQHASFT